MPDASRDPEFVGRRSEMDALLAGMEDAREGHGRLFLVSGEPGIGKSRLADELAHHARTAGTRVLWGRSWEAGGAPAFWPWVQPLRSYVLDADPEELRRQLLGEAFDVARIVPEIRARVPDVPEPPDLDPESARFRLFDATSRFLRSVAQQRPVVLVLDDLHAADTPSLLLLEFVASTMADMRLLIVAGYRDVDPTLDYPLSETLAQLARNRVTRSLPLHGLTERDVADYLERLLGAAPDPGLVAVVHSRTGGNPLFVVELVRLLAAERALGDSVEAGRVAVPPSVREVIQRRLRRLTAGSNEALAPAAVLGREFDVEALGAVTGVRSLALFEEAIATRVVNEVPGIPGRMRFSHALIRDTIYESLPSTERVRLHRLAAERLERLYGPRLDVHLAEVAHHFVEGSPGGDRAAVEYARRAGERAVRLLAYEEAVRLLDMALRTLDRSPTADDRARLPLLLGRGDARARSGDGPGSREDFVEAAEIAERLGAAKDLAAAALGYGGRFVWARAGDNARLVPLLRKALAALGEHDDPQRVRVLARLAGALRDERSREPRTTLSLQALEMARRLDDPGTLAWALDGRCAALLWPENPEERVVLATELVAVAEGAADQEKAVQGRYYRLMANLELGDLTAVRAELDVLDLLTRDLHQPAQRWLVTVTRATLALFEGRLEEAERLIPAALSLGERAQSGDALLSERIQRFALHRERGTLQEARAGIERSVPEFPARPMFRCMLAVIALETGEEEEARGILDGLAANDFEALPRTNEWLFSMGMLADVAADLADHPHAEELYALLLPHATRNGATADYLTTGSVARSLGVLVGALGRWDEAERHLASAVTSNDAMGARPWSARARTDLAWVLLARNGPGDAERARRHLEAAAGTARRLGLDGLRRRIDLLLEGPPPSAGTPPTAVFRQEGDTWLIVFEGSSFRLRDLRGLHHLARLLAEPGREFHVLDLARGLGVAVGPPNAGLRPDGGNAGAWLDATAKEAYRRRLRELDDEAEEAELMGDEDRAARSREEREAIAVELARAVGLGGRDRRAGSASERARAAVTRAIRAALARIADHHPGLGAHLDLTIRTGTYCSYQPDPRAPIAWHI